MQQNTTLGLFDTQHEIKQMIAKFEQVNIADELTNTLKSISKESGYKCLGFIDFCPVSASSYEENVYGEISAELADEMADSAIYHHCKSGIRLLPLSSILKHSRQLSQVYVMPMRGVTGIYGGLVFDIPESFCQQTSIEFVDWCWTIISPYLLQAALRCRDKKLHITKREKDCLIWACEGKTSWEISQILGISERTVNFHLSNCIVKTDSTNRQQAIVKCIINNLV
ncbi:helix-turn-helix transcriptional regulator [Pseudoalteromonas rubra]|nr:helix-turn-helix transcriptional regulator [Pseudoalteromonas rubra]